MEAPLMSLPEVRRKNDLICQHRSVQRHDVNFRRHVRKTCVHELNEKEQYLRDLLHRNTRPYSHPSECLSTTTEIARTMEDLRELRAVLHQLSIDDDLADAHWKKHFALPENKLTHDERKFIRCFNPTTVITEVPRRTKSPVARSQEHEERLSSPSNHENDHSPKLLRSSSTVRRGGSMECVRVPLRRRRLDHVPLSRVFRVAENGTSGDLARRCFTPTTSPQRKVDNGSRPGKMQRPQMRAIEVAKANNNVALGMIQNNAFRDAHRCLTETVALLEAHPSDNSEREPMLAVTHCNLANCYRRAGQLAEAMKHMQQCSKIERICFGSATPSTVINIGALHLQLGEIETGASVVLELHHSLKQKKDAGDHVSRHLLSLCEEHLNTCQLYQATAIRCASDMHSRSRVSNSPVPDEDRNVIQPQCHPLQYDWYRGIVDGIVARRRARRDQKHVAQKSSCDASSPIDWTANSSHTSYQVIGDPGYCPEGARLTPALMDDDDDGSDVDNYEAPQSHTHAHETGNGPSDDPVIEKPSANFVSSELATAVTESAHRPPNEKEDTAEQIPTADEPLSVDESSAPQVEPDQTASSDSAEAHNL